MFQLLDSLNDFHWNIPADIVDLMVIGVTVSSIPFPYTHTHTHTLIVKSGTL